MGKIICFCGRKGSGKNTLSSFLHGYQLKALQKVMGFDLTENGHLVLMDKDDDGEVIHVKLEDLSDSSPNSEFIDWAMMNMWPFVKQYAFANPLKEICTGLFNIEPHKIYGTQEQKNEPTHLKWEDMPGYRGKNKGFMTGREFLQFFGTNVMRKIYEPVWVKYTMKTISTEDSALSIITDGRFNNEAEAVHKAGGKTIYLTRCMSKDKHASENGLSPEECSAVIDNQNLNVIDTTVELIRIIHEWGWAEPTEAKTAMTTAKV